jgi:predicted nucleic acid-binding protein
VPVLWSIEVGNVLLVATRRGRISVDDWPRIHEYLEALPIDIDLVSYAKVLDTVLPLADKYGLSVYDAMYLELALRFGLPLATLDKKLIAVCNMAGVAVV